MQVKPVSDRIFSIIVLYDMQTTFFMNALDGISDNDAHNRLNTKANHIAWLAGSVVHERFEIAKMLGVDKKHVADELFKDNRGIQDHVSYPPLAEFKSDWQEITPVLRDVLLNVTDERLDEKFEMMPGFTMAYIDLIAFVTYREANIIGQIALWRRLLGYEAMKYM